MLSGPVDFSVRIILIQSVMEGSSRFHHNLNFNLSSALCSLMSAFKFEGPGSFSV